MVTPPLSTQNWNISTGYKVGYVPLQLLQTALNKNGVPSGQAEVLPQLVVKCGKETFCSVGSSRLHLAWLQMRRRRQQRMAFRELFCFNLDAKRRKQEKHVLTGQSHSDLLIPMATQKAIVPNRNNSACQISTDYNLSLQQRNSDESNKDTNPKCAVGNNLSLHSFQTKQVCRHCTAGLFHCSGSITLKRTLTPDFCTVHFE